MAALILIKHSLPAIVPAMPASEWQLSDEGRARCKPLADAVARYTPAQIFASNEPKATATAQLMATHLSQDYQIVANLHEHVRVNVPWVGAQTFAAQVERCFAQPSALVLGEETADQAHSRFTGAVDALVAAQPGRTIAIVAHGTVISLYAARAAGMDPFPLWQRLGLPSFIVLALPARTLTRVIDTIPPARTPRLP